MIDLTQHPVLSGLLANALSMAAGHLLSSRRADAEVIQPTARFNTSSVVLLSQALAARADRLRGFAPDDPDASPQRVAKVAASPELEHIILQLAARRVLHINSSQATDQLRIGFRATMRLYSCTEADLGGSFDEAFDALGRELGSIENVDFLAGAEADLLQRVMVEDLDSIRASVQRLADVGTQGIDPGSIEAFEAKL